MTVSIDTIRTRINASATTVSDDDINDAILAAVTLVNNYIGAVVIDVTVTDRATAIVAVEMLQQEQAPNGVLNQQYDFVDGARSVPIRIGRDPMAQARPILDPFVTGRYYCA